LNEYQAEDNPQNSDGKEYNEEHEEFYKEVE